MKRMTILTAAFLCLFGLTESTEQNNQSSRNMEDLNLTQEWDKTFPKSDKVNETVLHSTSVPIHRAICTTCSANL